MHYSNCVRVIAAAAVGYCAGMALSNTVWAAASPLGVWYDHTRSGAIEIKKCGKLLCGYIVWTKDPKDAKKGCGKPLIRNVKYVGNNTWDRGLIYSPTDGKDYSVELKPVSRSKLKVLGYAGSKFFSKTMYWKRAPSNIKRCDNKGTGSKSQVAKKSNGAGKSGKARASTVGSRKVKTAALTDAPLPARRPAGIHYAEQPKPIVAASVAESGLVPPRPVLAQRPNTASPKRVIDPRAFREGRMDLTGDSTALLAEGAAGKAKKDDGFCNIRVPFVTISIPCK